MPFAEQGSLVAGLLQQLWESLLGVVEHAGGVVGEAVGVAVFARHHACATGAAERVCHVAIGEAHTVGSDAVEVGCAHIAAVVATHHLRRVVVGHDVDNVQWFGLLGFGGGRQSRRCKRHHGDFARSVVGQQLFHVNHIGGCFNLAIRFLQK